MKRQLSFFVLILVFFASLKLSAKAPVIEIAKKQEQANKEAREKQKKLEQKQKEEKENKQKELEKQLKKDKKQFKKVKPSKNELLGDSDAQIPRTFFDTQIDDLIHKNLGSHFRRTNVFDLYPNEIPAEEMEGLNYKDQVELMTYYNYARRDLEKICGSKLLRVIKIDFDLDSKIDTALIVYNLKKEENYLVIISGKEIVYQEKFKADFIEKVNEGKYPTTVIVGKNRQNISSPAIRLVGFDCEPKILYYNKTEKKFVVI
ncbi:MAG: hypothetical protein LW817_07935 [Candidatus Caenarcaniphilales bacterium]|jgi:hypothetical protein|nr:hypothetical protein [Candidatus Caenarcaniphilales bacterium]